MPHPFIDLIGLRLDASAHGRSRCSLQVEQMHLNSAGAVHGAVLFALADTGMGKALYSALDDPGLVATIEAKISFFKPVTGGLIVCESELINPGTTIAALESTLTVDGVTVARAYGTFNIRRKPRASTGGAIGRGPATPRAGPA